MERCLCVGEPLPQPLNCGANISRIRWGCRAFTSRGAWFQVRWPKSWESMHITVKELAPIVLACGVWGPEWCDNAAVVAIVRSGTCKHPLAMHLLRCLAFFVAYYQLYLETVHLPGACNEAAEALSRDNLSLFLQLTPRAQRVTTPLPDSLLRALVHTTLDWSSPAWTAALLSTLRKD